MVKYTLYVFTVFSFTIVISEWVELPKVTPLRDIVKHPSEEVTMASLISPISQIFTKSKENVTTSPFMDKTEEIKGIEITENNVKIQKNNTMYFGNDEDNFVTWTNYNDISHFESDEKNDVEDSYVLEETINETSDDFIAQPLKGITGKLEYLKQLEDKLLFQTRMYAEGIWTDHHRQSRGKKLIGFPSMEGALMTIAFLTFAVFLIKIVMQFIQGIQNTEQTLLMTLSSTPAPVRLSNRPKRAAQNLAAAQILRYIDEYSGEK